VGAKAKIERAWLDVEFTEVKAPMTGRIGRRDQVSVGNLISGGTLSAEVFESLRPSRRMIEGAA